MLNDPGQAGEASANGAAISAVKITSQMISEAAKILEASPFCEMSQGIAEDVAEEMLRCALNLGFDRKT